MKNTRDNAKQEVGGDVKNDSIRLVKDDELNLRGKIYEVRGERVMLDFDLAKIYGYTTKAFNQQVKNNIEKFEGGEFMFRLTRAELNGILKLKIVTMNDGVAEMNDLSRSKFLTLNSGRGNNIKYLPYAFTEQGIYMLMTVLRGELAVRQSRALVMMFRRMKDYIIENRDALEYKNNLEMAMRVAQNSVGLEEVKKEIKQVKNEVREEFEKVNDKAKLISDKMDEMVLKSDLSPILMEFSEATQRKEFLLLEGELAKADVTYMDIYGKAKQSVYIIDNYINIKSLRHLQSIGSGVEVTIFSDNVGNYLHRSDYEDFCREFPEIEVKFIRIGGGVHDRFIVLDFGMKSERMFHCGASSKDAGSRLTVIHEWDKESIVRRMMNEIIVELLNGKELILK